jgi:hypothetical protein
MVLLSRDDVWMVEVDVSGGWGTDKALFTHDNVLYHASEFEMASRLVETDQGRWHRAVQEAEIIRSKLSRVQDIHRNREFTCTNPTQPKMAYLSS